MTSDGRQQVVKRRTLSTPELRITIGPNAFEEGNYIYVWFKSKPRCVPFYVGETSKSIADRVGLHIRKSGTTKRSGSVVGSLIHEESLPRQQYVVLAFELSSTVLHAVALENGASGSAAVNRARKAIEYAVHLELERRRYVMHRARVQKWKAMSATLLTQRIGARCERLAKAGG
jgi:hypothetical protein